MTWTTQAYCTLADVKLALDPDMSTNDDTFISGLIEDAQADIDAELGYSFQQDGTTGSPATRLYDGTGDYGLVIDDLVSLTQVIETYKNTYETSGGIWAVASITNTDITSDIIVKPNNYTNLGIPANKLVRNSGNPFYAGYQNYQVIGVFGSPYNANQTYPGVPNDISRACIRLTIHYYKMRDTNYADTMSERGGVRQSYVKAWPADVMRIIRKYQRHLFLTGERFKIQGSV